MFRQRWLCSCVIGGFILNDISLLTYIVLLGAERRDDIADCPVGFFQFKKVLPQLNMENAASEEALRIIPDSEEEVLPSSPGSSAESTVSPPTRQTLGRVGGPCHQDFEDVATAAFKTTEEARLNIKDCHESVDSPKELATNTQLNGAPTKPEQISATECKSKTSSSQGGHKLQVFLAEFPSPGFTNLHS